MEKFQNEKNRESTNVNYMTVWRSFNKFIMRLDSKPRLWEDRVNLFVTHLINLGRKSSTVKSYMSVIKGILTTFGQYKWDDKLILLASLTRACCLRNDRVYSHLPIQLRLLDLMMFELNNIFQNQPYVNILYKTVLMFGFYGLMRVGEITQGTHVALAKNVHIGTNKNKILVVLFTSKSMVWNQDHKKSKSLQHNGNQKHQ